MESDIIISDDNDSDVEEVPRRKCNKSYGCKTCGKKFTDFYSLKNHELTHATDFPYKCSLCPFRAKTKKYVSRHNKRMHMEIKGPKCKFCGKAFLFKSKMEEHMMVHTGEKPFKCNYCPKAFRVNYSLKNHLLIHANEKPYKCSFCNYSCRDNSTLRKHQNKHMGLSKLYNCNMCPKSYEHKYLLNEHISEFHMNLDIRKFKCHLCDTRVKSRSRLNAHVRIVHEQIYASKCPICGVKVSNKYNLKSHMLSHVDYRPYKCTYKGCTKVFKALHDLKKHTVIHKPELHYKCNKCEATFSRKHRLEYHKKTHKARKKRVICDYCGVKFYTKNYIIKHIREKHTDGQVYICDVCGYECRNKPGLVQHMRYSHLDCKKENECKMCHTKYKKYEYLKNHYLRTHNIKYKMVKPYREINKEAEETETKPEVIVKMEPVDEEYDTFSLLDIDKEEIQDPDYKEYSNEVLTEDVSNSVLGPTGNCDESQFDQFLVTHMTENWPNSSEMENNTNDNDYTEVIEGAAENCDLEILRKTNEKVEEMYKMSEKLREAEKKKAEAKKMEEKKKKVAQEMAEKRKLSRKAKKQEAKTLAEIKKQEAKKLAEKKKRDEEELAKKQENEFKELEKLRIRYNEIISNMKKASKKKEKEKIIYYKANNTNTSKEKVQNENDSSEENDSEEDDLDFTVKQNQINDKTNITKRVYIKSSNNDFNKINDPNKINETDKNNEVTNENNSSDCDNYSEEEISFAVKPTNNEDAETDHEISEDTPHVETNFINDKMSNIHGDNRSNGKPNDVMNKQCDESLDDRVEYEENVNTLDETNDCHVKTVECKENQNENSAKDIHSKETNDNHDKTIVINDKNSTKDIHSDETSDKSDGTNDKYNETNVINEENSPKDNHCDDMQVRDKNSVINDNQTKDNNETDIINDENGPKNNHSDETNVINDENSVKNGENSAKDNRSNETSVINEVNTTNIREIQTRSGRKLKPRKFFGDDDKQDVNDDNEKQNSADKNDKHPKLNIKSHQCYICFKLYPTKEELMEHCQIHFDICSLKTLTKCPICNFVTYKCLSNHLLKKHDINLRMPFQKIEEKPEKEGSKYFLNAKGTIIDIIPSIKILNFQKNKEFEKQNKLKKNQAITKTKLIKKGKEWIVQREDLNTDFDLLPEFTETEYKKLKISDNYIDRFKQIYKLTKKRNLKMAFPCLDCSKICQSASALKLHNRLHQNNPAPFKSRKEVQREKQKKEKIAKKRKETLNIDTRKPKPIKNNHKCDKKLKEFFENNIQGGDIEFWQFLKIFNKMDREEINDFEQLEKRQDFGIHTMQDKRITVAKNKRKISNTSINESNTSKKRNKDNQLPNTSKNNKTVTKK